MSNKEISEAAVGLAASVVFMMFPHTLINIFGAANESVYYTDFAVKCIRIFLCLLVLSCVNKGTFASGRCADVSGFCGSYHPYGKDSFACVCPGYG